MVSKHLVFLLFLLLVISGCGFLGAPFTTTKTNMDSNVLFKDDFSDPSSGWDRRDEADGVADYVDGVYRIFVNKPSYDIWANPGLDFTDTIIEVETKKIGGPDDNDFGIICRYQGMANYYFFIISSDGYYGIARMVDGQQELIGEKTMAFSDVILQGEKMNKLRIKCIDDRLALSVNDTLLMEVKDTTFSSGDVGLIAGTFDLPGTDVAFDNFIVRSP